MRLSRDSILDVRRRKRGTTRDMMVPIPDAKFDDRGKLIVRPDALDKRAATYEEWRLDSVHSIAGEVCPQIFDPMPLIRCTMPVPCGVCWYCKSHDQNRRSP